MAYEVGQEYSAGELTIVIRDVCCVTKHFSRITFRFVAKSALASWDFDCGSDELDRMLSEGRISLIKEEV